MQPRMKKSNTAKKPRRIVRKKLFNLTSPIFVETLLIMLTGATDVFMLSRYSDATVAAGGVVNQLLNLVFILYGITTLGTSVLCSQYLGARQGKNVAQVIGVSLLVNLVMGVFVSAGLYFFAPQSLRLMGLDENLIGYGVSYMTLVGGFSFLQAIAMTLSAILRSHNKAYYPMFVTLLINIINVIGNYFLIFGNGGAPRRRVAFQVPDDGGQFVQNDSRLRGSGLEFGFAQILVKRTADLLLPFPDLRLQRLEILFPDRGIQRVSRREKAPLRFQDVFDCHDSSPVRAMPMRLDEKSGVCVFSDSAACRIPVSGIL